MVCRNNNTLYIHDVAFISSEINFTVKIPTTAYRRAAFVNVLVRGQRFGLVPVAVGFAFVYRVERTAPLKLPSL